MGTMSIHNAVLFLAANLTETSVRKFSEWDIVFAFWSSAIQYFLPLLLIPVVIIGFKMIPDIIRYFFPERGKMKKKVPVTAVVNAIPVDVAIAEATAEDNEVWIRYLAQPNRPTRKPGLTVKDEYEQWLVARIGSRRATASIKSPA
jgi:hypothetical protein